MNHSTHPWHRRSLRLQGYDYRQAGAYFITVCCHQRACLFGDIVDGAVHLNHAGRAVQEAWEGLPARFTHLECDAFIILPNHLHGILVFADTDHPVHLGDVVGAFKSLTVHRYAKGVREENWPRYHVALWQRNYYEHVIRDEPSLNRIREYIASNPDEWANDPENPQFRTERHPRATEGGHP